MIWIWECMVLSFKAAIGGFFWILIVTLIPMIIGLIINWLEKIAEKFGY